MGQSHALRDAVARKTFLQFGTERLVALCEAVGSGGDFANFVQTFRQLLRPWGECQIGERPRFPSNVADDQAPFEFALGLSHEAPEVQVYVEVQGEPPSLRTNMEAGRGVLPAIARELDAPLDRLRRIEDLFFPEQPGPDFSMWIGISWCAGRPILLKVYLNPQVRGAARSHELITQAMVRLGFERSWSAAYERLSSCGWRDGAAILCLDLGRGEGRRVKVYFRHHGATAKEVEAITSVAQDYQAGDVARFYSALMQSEGPFLGRPAITELAFVDPRAERPASSTVEFPIGSYVENDELASRRVERCMAAFGVPSDTYARAIRAFALRPLHERSGIHAHVTLRRVDTRPRVAVYLASEAYLHTAQR